MYTCFVYIIKPSIIAVITVATSTQHGV